MSLTMKFLSPLMVIFPWNHPQKNPSPAAFGSRAVASASRSWCCSCCTCSRSMRSNACMEGGISLGFHWDFTVGIETANNRDFYLEQLIIGMIWRSVKPLGLGIQANASVKSPERLLFTMCSGGHGNFSHSEGENPGFLSSCLKALQWIPNFKGCMVFVSLLLGSLYACIFTKLLIDSNMLPDCRLVAQWNVSHWSLVSLCYPLKP